MTRYLQVDPSYTRIADEARQPSNKEYTLLPRFAPFLSPNVPLGHQMTKANDVARISGHASAPDEQFACVDMLYFATTSAANQEWEKPWSPVWRSVGQNLRFTDRLLGITRGMLVKTLGLENPTDLPLARPFQLSRMAHKLIFSKFISVHVRRGDFGDSCQGSGAAAHCSIPLSAFAVHVRRIREDLIRKKGQQVEVVFVFSGKLPLMVLKHPLSDGHFRRRD